jgi:hypothetical protein
MLSTAVTGIKLTLGALLDANAWLDSTASDIVTASACCLTANVFICLP